jgi:hypothetical protein
LPFFDGHLPFCASFFGGNLPGRVANRSLGLAQDIEFTCFDSFFGAAANPGIGVAIKQVKTME